MEKGIGAAELVEESLRRVAVLAEESGLVAAVEELAFGPGTGSSGNGSSRMGQAGGMTGPGGAPADELLRAVAAAAAGGGPMGCAVPAAVSARYQAVSVTRRHY